MTKSDSILGRARNQVLFDRRKEFRVSAYYTNRGQLRYTDAIGRWGCAPTLRVVYRVRVYPRKVTR